MNCSPYLVIRTLLKLAEDTENECPLAAHILRNSMYVDDVLAGTHDLETSLVARDQVIVALSLALVPLNPLIDQNCIKCIIGKLACSRTFSYIGRYCKIPKGYVCVFV